ncbi:hypothetical protein JHK85_013327 [Glycine max]|nr:hypothetical protein JHK85_013327 [Glycine max]
MSPNPQRSEEWFALRKDKLTTGTFGTALGFWKGSRRPELWQEKVFASEAQIMEANNAMAWGTLKEAVAVEQYKKITGDEVSSMGFAVHLKQSCYWLGASPDGVLGILEVNCPHNKGKPEAGLPWERDYWNLIHDMVREFWWENVVPAREALLLGREEVVKSYKPASTHQKTGLAIAKSIKLAHETKLFCRELAGHVEFYS